MENNKIASHAVWDCKYHYSVEYQLLFTVLAGDVENRCRELLREIAMSKEMKIYGRIDQS